MENGNKELRAFSRKEYLKPTFRCGTQKAIDALAEELNLPHNSSDQDWSYTAGNPDSIETFITHYEAINDADKKFVLMEFIIQATEEQRTDELFTTCWNKIKPLLEKDFILHEYTVYYWSCFDNGNSNPCWKISPLMRKLWEENRKQKLLFVCTVNRMRSATAHKIYENDSRFSVRSAGTDRTANTVISDEILNWADSIIVMEKQHRNYIRQRFPQIYKNKKIVCLYIPDDYAYMQNELIELLKDKIEDIYKRHLI